MNTLIQSKQNTKLILDNFLQQKLNDRKGQDALRALQLFSENRVDFYSNDYLGFAQSQSHKEKIQQVLNSHPTYKTGSTGSRLISGNYRYTEELEQKIASFHHAEAALIFNSGYDANVGLLSCIAQRGDTIICDELIHASIIDGARLSLANKYTFSHNNLSALESKLKTSSGRVFIVTESVFSMDGDCAPLVEICDLAEKFNASVIVDEAHALGVFGSHGEGLAQHLKLQDRIFARVYTFGKGLGCHGAAILGSALLKQYLINFARSFIYTTALPFHSLACIEVGYQALETSSEIETLQDNIKLFTHLAAQQQVNLISSTSAIQSKLVTGNTACKAFATHLQQQGFNAKAILSPTVPTGKERIRISLHAHNTKAEIYALTGHLNRIHE